MNRKIVSIIRSIVGYSWLIVFAVLGIGLFANLEAATQKIGINQKVKIIPKYTGGEVVDKRSKANYVRLIHEPVDNFIQVDWLGEEALPKQIEEEIDVNKDGILDLKVIIDTQNETIIYEKLSDEVTALMKKTSLIELSFKASTNNKDSLFFYKNKEYEEIQYNEGVSIRILKRSL